MITIVSLQIIARAFVIHFDAGLCPPSAVRPQGDHNGSFPNNLTSPRLLNGDHGGWGYGRGRKNGQNVWKIQGRGIKLSVVQWLTAPLIPTQSWNFSNNTGGIATLFWWRRPRLEEEG
jgi:hypothetical protein